MQDHDPRTREAELSFLGRHGFTIIIVTLSAMTSAVILALIA